MGYGIERCWKHDLKEFSIYLYRFRRLHDTLGYRMSYEKITVCKTEYKMNNQYLVQYETLMTCTYFGFGKICTKTFSPFCNIIPKVSYLQ